MSTDSNKPLNQEELNVARQNAAAASVTRDDLSAATILLPLPNPAANGPRVSTIMRIAFSSGSGCQVREFDA